MEFRKGQPAINLGGEWRFTWFEADEADSVPDTVAELEACGKPIYKGQVPGNVELDLLRNGLIPDPFMGMNMALLRQWEDRAFVYWRSFPYQPLEGYSPYLVAEGLDCWAAVRINGKHLRYFGNALIRHEEAIGVPLQPVNEIVVDFGTHLGAAERDYERGQQAMGANWESLRVRKAPSMYGWDIMPRALLGGIWRPIRIEMLPDAHFSQAYLETTWLADDRSRAHLNLFYAADMQWDPRATVEVELTATCGDHRMHERRRALFSAGSFAFDVAEPAVWWPRGRGEQALYQCRLDLLVNGVVVDTVTFTHGIRSVRLERTSVTDDMGNGQFCFHVNGERFFALGSNWVPLDAFHSRDIQRVDAAMDLADEIGINMVRCWGGNVYESDRFYERCDQQGILVWQDFGMACAIYPQDEEFQADIAEEARNVVRRLRQHPCIVMWAGDNECDQSYLWGGVKRDPNTNVLTRKVLPDIIRREDPGRTFLPSSPYIDEECFAKGVQYLPEDHMWGPRDYFKSEYYRTALCHFASEIGYHGCPSPETIRKYLSPGKDWPYPNNAEWILHSTSPVPGVNLFDYRVELMASQVRVLFGTVPGNLEEYAFASQASQAEAKKFFIEWFRTAKWRRTGIIWWNLLDGWPQFSDAVVDYDFRRKLAFDYIKRSQAPLALAMREPRQGKQQLVACCDIRGGAPVVWTLWDANSGDVLSMGEARAEGDAVTVLDTINVADDERRFLVIDWQSDGVASRNHYLLGKPPFDLAWYRENLEGAGLLPTLG